MQVCKGLKGVKSINCFVIFLSRSSTIPENLYNFRLYILNQVQ